MSNTEIDHEYTDEVVCPHCGYEYQDSWEFIADYIDSMICDECCKSFSMDRDTTVSYTTQKYKYKVKE